MQMIKELLEFVVDTRLAGENNVKTGIPFHLQKQEATLIVMWGDKTHSILSADNYSDSDALASVHEYPAPGEYKISIYVESPYSWSDVYISTLDCQDAIFNCVPSLFNEKTECMRYFKQTLVELPTPLPRMKGSIQFTLSNPASGCNGIKLNENFSFLFIHCSSLRKIHPKLFSSNKHSISFSYCFYGCSKLEELHNEMFKGCSTVLSYAFCFFGCYELKTIPSNLFKDSFKAQGFRGVFKDCLGLRSIPENLFSGSCSAELFSEAFQNCISLQSIPERLFSRCPNVVGFSSTFENCICVTSVPENLFKWCPRVLHFRSTFSKSGLKHVPEDLFSDKKYVSSYSYVFSWCDIEDVPGKLFKDSIYAVDFSGCFYGCNHLRSVGRELFANSIYAKRFSHCFYGCKNLKKATIEIASRTVDTAYLFVEKKEDAEITVVAQKMSASAKMLSMKSEKLGITVEEKHFVMATLRALWQSILRIMRHD